MQEQCAGARVNGPCADGSSAILSTAREQERLEREAQKTKRGAQLCVNQLCGTGKDVDGHCTSMLVDGERERGRCVNSDLSSDLS